MKEILPPYLEQSGWQGSVEGFLEYWFSSDSEVDQELASFIQELKQRGIRVCLATNNEKYRAEYLLKTAGLEKIFDKAFVSAFIGHKKSSPEFFGHVMQNSAGLQKDEILFFDSDEKIVKGALAFGIRAELYTDFETFKQQIENLQT